jgi:hypothetical protein
MTGRRKPALEVKSQELQRIIESWPGIDIGEGSTGILAVHNSLNEVCHGLRIEEEDWSKWLIRPGSKSEILSASGLH